MGCGCGGNGVVKTLMAADVGFAPSSGLLVWVVVDGAGRCLIAQMGACVTYTSRAQAEQAAKDVKGQVQPVTLENDDA